MNFTFFAHDCSTVDMSPFELDECAIFMESIYMYITIKCLASSFHESSFLSALFHGQFFNVDEH